MMKRYEVFGNKAAEYNMTNSPGVKVKLGDLK
jgi:hypothetical protein